MTRVLLVFFAALGVLFSPQAAAESARIAVLELRGPVEADVLRLMTDEVRGGVLDATRGGDFIVMTRENMAIIAKDMGLDLSCVEGACEVETGRNLNAAYVVSGEVVAVGGSMNLMLKFHETEEGALRAKQRTKADSVDALVDAASALARAVTQQGLGSQGSPSGGAPAPSGGQVFGGYQGGNFGQDLDIDAQLKAQACDDAARQQGQTIRANKLRAAQDAARAAASADWQAMLPKLKACEQLKRAKREPCIDQIERWLQGAHAIPVGIRAGKEEVNTECGVRRPAFAEQIGAIAASEVPLARAQLRRLKAADPPAAWSAPRSSNTTSPRITSASPSPGSSTARYSSSPTFYRGSLRLGVGLDYGGVGVQGEFRPSENWSVCLALGGISDVMTMTSVGARWLPNSSGNMYFQAMGGVGSTFDYYPSSTISFTSLTVGSASRWKRFALDANIGVMVGHQSGFDSEVLPTVALGLGRNIFPD